jgi:hypothetical protein
MQIIEIKTLIDITCTGVMRLNQGTQLMIDQNRNFTTLKQCAELRSVIIYDNLPILSVVDVTGLGFGTNFKGTHNVWTFRFTPDRLDVYKTENGDEIGELWNDIHGVPVIKNLTETINIDKAVFNCKDSANKNTFIMAHQGIV